MKAMATPVTMIAITNHALTLEDESKTRKGIAIAIGMAKISNGVCAPINCPTIRDAAKAAEKVSEIVFVFLEILVDRTKDFIKEINAQVRRAAQGNIAVGRSFDEDSN